MSTKVQLSTKKRRIVTKSGDSPVSSPRESKRPKNTSERIVEVKEKLPYNEEGEIENTTIHQDVQLHKETCNNIQKFFKVIKDLKEEGRSQNAAAIAEKCTAASVMFVTLKKMNRISHLRCKKARDTTQATKQKVDGLHLQLQNLLYEVMHLQKEIKKCLEFESSDEKIELVDVATFYREAPLDISMPSVTEKDPHKQRLARLDWELEQRKRLSEKYDKSQSNRDHVDGEIKAKQEYLDSLQPRLKSILDSTIPVQEYLSLPFEEIRSQHQMARLLPRPLYILFVQASAYSEACDGMLSVKIEGDADTASATMTSSVVIEEDSDSDNEDNLTESKRRRKTVGDKLEEKRKKLLAKHPLQIVLHLTFKDHAQLILTFSYLMELKIVTVVVELKDSTGTQNLQGDLLSAQTVLNSLYPGDDGTNSPNPANTFQLQRIGIESLDAYLETIGIPYLWCQWLSGLDFLQCDETRGMKASTLLSSSHMEATVKALRARIRARLALQKQGASLGQAVIPVPTPAVKLFPPKLSSRLVSWKPITEEAMSQLDFVASHPAREAIEDNSFFYLATCERKSAKLQTLVAVRKAYPVTPPQFFIKLTWQGQAFTAADDHDILDMESEVNLYSQELISPKTCDYILSCQLQRLLMCLDLYLEAASAEESSRSPGKQVEFPKEKMFVRNARGRSRGKPYKYNPQYGYFSQR